MLVNRNTVNNFLYSPINPSSVANINNVNGFDPNLLNGTFRTYVQDMNNYINSDLYLQICEELSMYRDNNPIDILIYLATPDNWVLGKKMREMLMASPLIENYTRKGYLEGCYSMKNNLDNYNTIVNGFMVDDEEGEYVCRKWYTDEENEVLIYDQMIVQEVWEHAQGMISNGIDPTSFEE